MNCIYCGDNTAVVDSRLAGPAIRRRRKCQACLKIFATVELPEGASLSVDQKLVKRLQILNLRFLQLKQDFDTILAEAKELQ